MINLQFGAAEIKVEPMFFTNVDRIMVQTVRVTIPSPEYKMYVQNEILDLFLRTIKRSPLTYKLLSRTSCRISPTEFLVQYTQEWEELVHA